MLFGILVVDIETPFNALSNASALFFVVAISHVGLRSALNASGVVYLEYMFIIEYVFILLGAMSGMLYYSKNKYPIIHYKDNLILRLFYWPGMLGSLLVITFFTFYPRVPQVSASENALLAAPATTVAPTAAPLATTATPTQFAQATSTPLPAGTGAPATSMPPTAITIGADSVTLRFPLYGDPHTFDPSLSAHLDSSEQIDSLFIGLTHLNPSVIMV